MISRVVFESLTKIRRRMKKLYNIPDEESNISELYYFNLRKDRIWIYLRRFHKKISKIIEIYSSDVLGYVRDFDHRKLERLFENIEDRIKNLEYHHKQNSKNNKKDLYEFKFQFVLLLNEIEISLEKYANHLDFLMKQFDHAFIYDMGFYEDADDEWI